MSGAAWYITSTTPAPPRYRHFSAAGSRPPSPRCVPGMTSPPRPPGATSPGSSTNCSPTIWSCASERADRPGSTARLVGRIDTSKGACALHTPASGTAWVQTDGTIAVAGPWRNPARLRAHPSTPRPPAPRRPTSADSNVRRRATARPDRHAVNCAPPAPDQSCSGASMPSRPSPSARMRAVNAHSTRRLSRTSSSALRTGHCS